DYNDLYIIQHVSRDTRIPEGSQDLTVDSNQVEGCEVEGGKRERPSLINSNI
ncbi:hypothetical protein J6590_090823, partial [Homalodisca vitripennis]